MKKVFIAGHNGMVGSALFKLLKKKNVALSTIDKKILDLTNQEQVIRYFKKKKL